MKRANLSTTNVWSFLGDAILMLRWVTSFTVTSRASVKASFTNTRSKLVQRETLNKLAEEMGSSTVLSCHQDAVPLTTVIWEEMLSRHWLAQCIWIAVDACMKFINKRILAEKLNIDKVAYKEVNFKSKLIEWCQKIRLNCVSTCSIRTRTRKAILSSSLWWFWRPWNVVQVAVSARKRASRRFPNSRWNGSRRTAVHR